MPSVYEKMQEIQKCQDATLEERKRDVTARKAQLEAMKARLETRDGKETVDKRIRDFTTNQGGRS